MRIAVTYENGEIFQHFGHTEQFKVYDVENGKIMSAEVVDTNGSGHGALAGVLSALHVDALICGGFGGGSRGGGFGGGGFGGGSHCACASSCACACACACAGGGRAGCSAKNLYGAIHLNEDASEKMR